MDTNIYSGLLNQEVYVGISDEIAEGYLTRLFTDKATFRLNNIADHGILVTPMSGSYTMPLFLGWNVVTGILPVAYLSQLRAA